MTVTRVLAFHAEKLHDDQVWRRVEHVARWLPQQGIKATFFVYPFRAQVAGKAITARVRILAALGHEIGQHTHFYAGTKIDGPGKVDDLNGANMVHCLRRDFKTLEEMGFSPKGFTAGAWFINETVFDTLLELGFVYDCSARFPDPGDMRNSPYNRWLRSPELYSNTVGQLLCLPTSCSLGQWFKGARKISIEGKVPYQLICLHDYDLLSFRTRLLLSSLLKITKAQALMPSLSVAERYLSQRGEVPCL